MRNFCLKKKQIFNKLILISNLNVNNTYNNNNNNNNQNFMYFKVNYNFDEKLLETLFVLVTLNSEI